MAFVPAARLALLLRLCYRILSMPLALGLGPLAFDINKAHDQVSCPAMDAVLSHLGITSNVFYHLYSCARDKGPVRVTGAPSLSAPFKTSRGIK